MLLARASESAARLRFAGWTPAPARRASSCSARRSILEFFSALLRRLASVCSKSAAAWPPWRAGLRTVPRPPAGGQLPALGLVKEFDRRCAWRLRRSVRTHDRHSRASLSHRCRPRRGSVPFGLDRTQCLVRVDGGVVAQLARLLFGEGEYLCDPDAEGGETHFCRLRRDVDLDLACRRSSSA